jgi:uncharacterized cupredoxin-like copper-binding protein
LLAVIACALAIAVTGCGGDDNETSTGASQNSSATPGKPAATSKTISVTAKEFTLTPSAPSTPAGKVTFAVRNAGSIPHEFVVIRTPKPAANLLKGDEADEAGSVGEIGDLPAGATKKLTVKLTPGHYAFVCNLPGHYKAGQYADFTAK